MSTSSSVESAPAQTGHRIQKHLEKYVHPEIERLQNRATLWEKRANWWYCCVGVTLGMGVLFALCLGLVTVFRALLSIYSIPGLKPDDITWPQVVRNIASSLIFVGMLGAIVRFSYVMGKSCMVESIRNNNRRHALKFGEFYLEAFRGKVTWPEAKDAFSSWNIDIGSSFLIQNPTDVDPEILQNLATIVSAAVKKAG